MSPEELIDWPVDDLSIVSSESFTDEDGERCVCVYSWKLDAVTVVDATASEMLIRRGVQQIEALPR